MPRQPVPGAGDAVRTPSGAAAARPPALSPSSPLPPSRYRALRARHNALLITLYERTSLPLREIAALAGHTERSVQMLVRALGCRPRKGWCRPGTSLGLRRAGPKPPPLNAPATRRVATAFAKAARELAASADARADDDVRRAALRAMRRAVRARTRVLSGAARELRHLAATFEDLTMAKRALAEGDERARARKAARKVLQEPARPSPEELRRAQQRVLREQEVRMREAHRAKAAPPVPDAGFERGGDEMAERRNSGPRVRGL